MVAGHDEAVAALKRAVEELAVELPFEVRSHEDRVSLVIAGSPISTIFEVVDDRHFALFFYCRTSSWSWVGERTDLHDVSSVLFASALRALAGVSCRLVSVDNPAIDAPSEIYARYIVPAQPPLNAVPIAGCREDVADLLTHVFEALGTLHSIGLFSHGSDHQEFAFNTEELSVWRSEVCSSLQVDEADTEDSLTYERKHPSWWYFRSNALGISVIDCPSISAVVRRLSQIDTASTTELASVNGRLLIRDGVTTTVSYSSESGIRSILTEIDMAASSALFEPPASHTVALEDYLVMTTGNLVAAMDDETGLLASQHEREQLLDRHRREAEFLFTSTEYDWRHPLDPGKFEDLIVELLGREPGVTLAKKSGTTYDRDAERDIIIERIMSRIPARGALNENESPWQRVRLVGQCKTRRDGRAIGSNKVHNILDTIAAHNADGYLLAASSELTGSAVDRLNSLRERGNHHIEWWTSIDIEQRLRQNPDIATRYEELVVPRDANRRLR